MIFTVVWMPTALSKLADLWIHAVDRNAVANAANVIDSRLKNDAHLEGQPFFGQRTLAVPPLAVTFEASLDDRLVTVAEVKLIT
jgi:hypothetical protein